MGLFDKKFCNFCGEKIGLLGNKKLADGNMCKDCASKLSPFLSGRKEHTVNEIRVHLQYRAENERRLMEIEPTLVIGRTGTKVYVDERRGVFFVTHMNDWRRYNPDIIPLQQVVDCQVDVHEYKEELKDKGPDGRPVSFVPPRYKKEYTFDAELTINSPFFSHIRWTMTSHRLESRISPEYRQYEEEADLLMRTLRPDHMGFRFLSERERMADALQNAMNQVQRPPVAPAAPVAPVPHHAPEHGPAPVNHAPVAPTRREPEPPVRHDFRQQAANNWRCVCGEMNDGNFCSKCGKPKARKF